MSDPKLVIVTMPTPDLSASAERRTKHWIRRVDRVDTTISDGYCFVGQFTKFGATVEVANGTWFMSYVEDTRSNGRVDGRDVVMYQVRGGSLVKVEHWNLDANPGWALKVRDEIAAMIRPVGQTVEQTVEQTVDKLGRMRDDLLGMAEELKEIDGLGAMAGFVSGFEAGLTRFLDEYTP